MGIETSSVACYKSVPIINLYFFTRPYNQPSARAMSLADINQGASIQTQRLTGKIDWIKTIEVISGIRETAEEELKTHRSKALDGTCGWIALKETFVEWVERLDTPQKPRVFWLVGLPAMGKTMLASYVADYLSVRGVGGDCQYHYFSSGHQNKRTIAYCLRSIISQLAHTNEDFRKKLITFHEENGVSLDSQEQNFGFIWEKIFEGIIFKMLAKPLFWILDAVDEANDPSTLVTSIMRIQSHTPIKVFFTSRPMKIPSASNTFGSPITTFLLTENDTVDDIRAYAHDVVNEFLPDDAQEVRRTIIDEILAKAAGSFLWVRLALETLQDHWHTQDDISKALNEVPTGMEQLYKRMIERIETQSTRNKMMAKRILTWAACCWRPLSIAELRVALEPEFTGFVRLQDTIVQLCGNFISVDNGKLSLIHDTARHFLLNDRPDATAFIDPEYGHKHMATVCIDYLSDDNWKRVFKTLENSPTTENTISLKTDRVLLAEARHPFLDYAICFWAFHVSKSSLESDHLLLVLKGFLAKYCLSWIQAVALLTDFRFVTRSAQSLITYTRRMPARRRGHIPGSLSGPALSPNDDAKTIQSWAVDFVRLVRKFGSNLVQSPSAIHRYVAPLCPRTSMISTFYGSRERSISVTGFPFENWDDCLASVSVGNEDTASTVIATETYFLTLISNGGMLVSWQANTCEEVLRMHHNEYVSSVAMDSSRTLLATAGSESYRIWDIASGKELHCLQKTARYLTEALAFGSTGSELVIGLDDCSVTCYDLESSQTKWHFAVTDHSEFPGCPFVMELSPDLTKLALAWRNKPPIVWDMPEAQSQRSLKCRNWIGTLDLCAPKAMQWQPDGNSVLVLSQNTEVVEWHFYDGEQHKFDHIKAHTMTISRDSKLLLTSDIMGNISIWTFPRLELLYQLVNESGFVKGLAFSPDNRRFYGTIGSICNVWEPDALLSPYQHRRRDETSTSSDHTATEALLADDKPEVNAIAYSSDDEYFCAGNEAGLVSIHNAHDGRRIRKVSTHNSTSSVILLAWSYSNKYIVSADDASRVIAKRVEAKEANTWSVFPVFDFYAHAAVQQFLFNASEKLLLVSTSLADMVWDFKGQKEVCCRQWGPGQGRKWIQHPFQKEMLIWIDPFAVRTFSWKELAEISSSQPSTTGNIADPVGKAPEDIDSARSPIADGISTDLTIIGNANSTPSPRTGNTSTERPITAEQHPTTESTAVATTDTNGKAVLWIALMDNKQYIVYLCKTSHSSTSLSHGLYLEFLSTSNFQVRQPHSLTSDFDDLAAQIMYLIGVYKDSVVFLDQDYWICTWRIYDGFSDVTRHFFIPKDWLDYSTMHMAALNAQGTFFCPKKEDVAIVRHGMRF